MEQKLQVEQWDTYNIDRLKTGNTALRGTDLKGGEYHQVVHICIFNSKGQMLIQQRQPFKSGWPNLWDVTVGGSCLAGETSRDAAERELFEEIGFKRSFSGLRPSFTINFLQGFDDFYLIHEDVDLSELSLQEEEVQAVRWASEEEIHELLKNGQFIPYYGSLISMLFQMKNSFGAHQYRETE